MSQLKEDECFIDAGIYSWDKPPDGHKKIHAHLVFDVKHDGHHKARYVAGGHLTDVPNASVYSGVVSLRGLWVVAFLSELNGNALSFHRVCKAIASGYVVLTHLPGKFNLQIIWASIGDTRLSWAYLVLPWRYSRPHSRLCYYLDIPPTGIFC
jgi:hypothetical protein